MSPDKEHLKHLLLRVFVGIFYIVSFDHLLPCQQTFILANTIRSMKMRMEREVVMTQKNMKFIVITGPMAVGKMAVGMALAEKTGLKLFHNHMTIEPVIRLFPYGSQEAQYLIAHFRQEIFRLMAESDMPGMIFTFVWAFDMPSEYDYIDKIMKQFEDQGADTYIVELEADLEVRLERNRSPLRLSEKASKKDVVATEERMLKTLETHRLNSLEGEITHPSYLRINNSDLTEEEVADGIIDFFCWH